MKIEYKTPEHIRLKAKEKAELKRREKGIKKKKTFKENFKDRCFPITETGCFIWMGYIQKNGYGQVFMNGKLNRAHRASWEIEYGAIPHSMNVLHKCDNPSCVNPAHLFLGTQADNMRDMNNKNRESCGEKNIHSKLTKENILAIRADSRGSTIIAKQYAVTAPTIWAIQKYKTWKKVS